MNKLFCLALVCLGLLVVSCDTHTKYLYYPVPSAPDTIRVCPPHDPCHCPDDDCPEHKDDECLNSSGI